MVIRNDQTGQMEGYRPPRADVNAPDLYIPFMAFVSYFLIVGTLRGQQLTFTPEVLGLTATTAAFLTACEVLILRIGIYLLNISTQDPPIYIWDLISFAGYKFVRYG
jgi:hypothetical protein